jgi:hypothetical protein
VDDSIVGKKVGFAWDGWVMCAGDWWGVDVIEFVGSDLVWGGIGWGKLGEARGWITHDRGGNNWCNGEMRWDNPLWGTAQ